MTAPSQNGKRAMCEFCDRPQKTCLCETLPTGDDSCNGSLRSTSPHVQQIVILQHPQEKKQKHCSDYFLLRTLANVHCVVARKLHNVIVTESDPGVLRIDLTNFSSSNHIFCTKCLRESGVAETGNSGASSISQETRLLMDKQRTFVLYPHDSAITNFDELRQRLDTMLVESDEAQQHKLGIQTLIVVDATWQYAKEMIQNCELLQGLPKVALSMEALKKYKSEFIVRKPEKVKVGNGEILGFSTAEAVAIFLEEWCTFCALADDMKPNIDESIVEHELACKRQKTNTEVRSLYETVLAPLRKYVEYQLAFTSNVKHRTDRKDYDPNLYAERSSEAKVNNESR